MSRTARALARTGRIAVLPLVLAGTTVFTSSPTRAADAHRAVTAKHGEMVLLRNVNTRVAYRPAPPGVALIVNPSPKRELDSGLGIGELSDADYANLDASTGTGRATHGTTVERMVGGVLGDSLGGGTHPRDGVAVAGMGTTLAGPMGTLGNTTRGIGNQVQGALSQLPGMTTTAAPGR